HMRFSRDWSSDVCSSDLHPSHFPASDLVDGRHHLVGELGVKRVQPFADLGVDSGADLDVGFYGPYPLIERLAAFARGDVLFFEKIGRPSCRESSETMVHG